MKQTKTTRPGGGALGVLTAAVLVLAVSLSLAVGGIPLGVAALMFGQGARAQAAAAPETQTAATTAAATTATVTTTTAAAQPMDLTVTPADILALMERAKQQLGDGSGGRVKTVTYGKSSATDAVGNVLIKNTTETKTPDFAAALKQPLALTVPRDQPAVLIFHSHTSEAYALTARNVYDPGFTARSNDPARNVVRVGDEIAHILEANGYTVIHDTVIHDDDYTGSYPHSRKTLAAYLAQHPQLQVLLDIHRDSIDLEDGTKMRPVATVNGKQAAQMMIITGAQEGKVTDFPDWEQNLHFALHLQQRLTAVNADLMRPLLFSPRQYNMDLTHFSLLIEMGSEANTLEEACYAGRLLGQALADLLKEYTQ